jgi:protein-S-isoprenylcysteine O-methyltransferase Ste14
MDPLYRKAFNGLAILFLITAAILFGAAGTFAYWQAWLYLVVYFSASVAISLYLIRRDPALLARRMSGGPFAEKEPAQRIIMSIMSLGFIALAVVPALDRRFGWSHVPSYAVALGDLVVLLGWLGIYFVFRENSFAASTIVSSEDQSVISTGPYAWVRHPMYTAAFVMLLGISPSLGSWWGLPIAIATLPTLIWRLKDEERFLVRNLPGYPEYQERVRYRLLPFCVVKVGRDRRVRTGRLADIDGVDVMGKWHDPVLLLYGLPDARSRLQTMISRRYSCFSLSSY